jgi:glucose/arabinose dehydrogenase
MSNLVEQNLEALSMVARTGVLAREAVLPFQPPLASALGADPFVRWLSPMTKFCPRLSLTPKTLAALFVLFSGWGHITASAASPYRTNGECNGLPRVALKTPPGFCVGLVAEGFKYPRGLVVLPGGDLIVADMFGWVENRGSLWRLSRSENRYVRTRLFDKLDRPNSLTLGPDGKVYVGTAGRVFRFDPAQPANSVEDIIGGGSALAPLPSKGRHPLPQIVFDLQRQLFVNIGSASDNCEGPAGSAPDGGATCPETEGSQARGLIRQYSMQWPQGRATGWTEYAKGLRNSMALAVHPLSGELWQAENSRDAISARDATLNDQTLPHDELNLIHANGHYGWPYCYDNNSASPEYANWNCADYTPAVRLLPGHAAPLGMAFLNSHTWPRALQGALLIAFHGYRANGHRLMAYPFDATGHPKGAPVELIGGWDASSTTPMGAPVDIKMGADGTVFLSEDRNGTVLRLVYRKTPSAC